MKMIGKYKVFTGMNQFQWSPFYDRRIHNGQHQVQIDFLGSLVWINVDEKDTVPNENCRVCNGTGTPWNALHWEQKQLCNCIMNKD